MAKDPVPPTLESAVKAELDARFGNKKKAGIGSILAVLIPILTEVIQAWLASRSASTPKK